MDAMMLRKVIDEALAAQREQSPPAADVKAIVHEAITATLNSFGIEKDDRKEFQIDLRHLRKWRKSVESAQGLSFKVVVGTIISGFLGMVWMGFKVMLGKS